MALCWQTPTHPLKPQPSCPPWAEISLSHGASSPSVPSPSLWPSPDYAGWGLCQMQMLLTLRERLMRARGCGSETMSSGGAQGLPVPNCQCGRWGRPLLKQQQRPTHWAGHWQPVRVEPNLVTQNKPSATRGLRGAGVPGAARDKGRDEDLGPGAGRAGPLSLRTLAGNAQDSRIFCPGQGGPAWIPPSIGGHRAHPWRSRSSPGPPQLGHGATALPWFPSP